MRMAFETSLGTLVCTGLSIGCAAITGVAQFTQNFQSGKAEENRVKALKTIAQHVNSASCWEVSGDENFKIGEDISMDGKGKAPTSCFINPKGQFGYAAYLNDRFQIVHVFTPREVQAKKSELVHKE